MSEFGELWKHQINPVWPESVRVSIMLKLDISNTCSKANKVLGFLRHNLKISTSNIKEKTYIYKAFIRPLLEYAAFVWDLYSQKNIAKIEAVQRRAARFVLNRFRNTLSVNNMLKALGWPALEQ